ncbi:MAG: hydrogenase maturation nickel metallochaperone HypA [Bacillota bacterium]
MHELGIVFEIVRTVENAIVDEDVSSIDTIVLQVGELSGIVPIYLDECWPAAIDKKPLFKNTKLQIDVTPGMAKCQQCGENFNVLAYEGFCPKCNSFDKDVLCGLEFLIKEILVPED